MSVSVVIPLYQQAPQVGRAVASVLRQTSAADEIIVVDDGSTDGGAEAAREAGGARITVHRRPHAGESAARNHGVAMASSEWIGLLDSDDEWYPGFLEKTRAAAARLPGVVAVFSDMTWEDSGRRARPRESALGSVIDDYFRLVLDGSLDGMSSSSTLVRRSALVACGGFPDGVRIGGDLDTWARLAWSGPIAHVPECLALYHVDALTRATEEARLRGPEYPELLRTYRRWLEAGRIPEPLRRSSRAFAGRVLAEHAMELAHADRGREAQRLLRDEWIAGAPRHLGLKAWLWAHLPAALLRRLRSTRRGARLALGRRAAWAAGHR